MCDSAYDEKNNLIFVDNYKGQIIYCLNCGDNLTYAKGCSKQYRHETNEKIKCKGHKLINLQIKNKEKEENNLEKKISCPHCDEILKLAKGHPHYFKHSRQTKINKSTCSSKKDYKEHKKSDFHQKWQAIFPAEYLEKVLEFRNDNILYKNRADIYLDKPISLPSLSLFFLNLVIEIQHSNSIKEEDMNQRKKTYQNLIWICDIEDCNIQIRHDLATNIYSINKEALPNYIKTLLFQENHVFLDYGSAFLLYAHYLEKDIKIEFVNKDKFLREISESLGLEIPLNSDKLKDPLSGKFKEDYPIKKWNSKLMAEENFIISESLLKYCQDLSTERIYIKFFEENEEIVKKIKLGSLYWLFKGIDKKYLNDKKVNELQRLNRKFYKLCEELNYNSKEQYILILEDIEFYEDDEGNIKEGNIKDKYNEKNIKDNEKNIKDNEENIKDGFNIINTYINKIQYNLTMLNNEIIENNRIKNILNNNSSLKLVSIISSSSQKNFIPKILTDSEKIIEIISENIMLNFEDIFFFKLLKLINDKNIIDNLDNINLSESLFYILNNCQINIYYFVKLDIEKQKEIINIITKIYKSEYYTKDKIYEFFELFFMIYELLNPMQKFKNFYQLATLFLNLFCGHFHRKEEFMRNKDLYFKLLNKFKALTKDIINIKNFYIFEFSDEIYQTSYSKYIRNYYDYTKVYQTGDYDKFFEKISDYDELIKNYIDNHIY